MKLNRNVGLLVVAIAGLSGAASIAYAQSTTSSSTTPCDPPSARRRRPTGSGTIAEGGSCWG